MKIASICLTGMIGGPLAAIAQRRKQELRAALRDDRGDRTKSSLLMFPRSGGNLVPVPSTCHTGLVAGVTFGRMAGDGVVRFAAKRY